MQMRIKAGWALAAFAAGLAAIAPAVRSQTQPQQQNPPQQQPAQQTQQDTDSVADAARKAKADKPATPAKKVYNTEDLASSSGSGGVSTVGDTNAAKDDASAPADKSAGAKGGEPVKDEAYWRGRAQTLREQMAQVDAQIAQLQDEMKKGGNAGFNVQSGVASNTIYFEDRDTKLKKLEEKKAQIQKQMDDLEEEARKADVPASWVR